MPITNQNLYLISSAAETLATIVDRQAGAIHEAASGFDALRNQAVDVGVSLDERATKGDIIKNLDDMGNRCDLATTALRHGMLDAGDMANEIFAALCLRAADLAGVLASPADTAAITKILRERANNIAAMYAARVTKEPA